MPVNLVANALGSGQVDGAEVPLWVLFQFGIGRITTNHYLLHAGANSLALVMNRRRSSKACLRKPERLSANTAATG